MFESMKFILLFFQAVELRISNEMLPALDPALILIDRIPFGDKHSALFSPN